MKNNHIVTMKGIVKKFPGIIANCNADFRLKKGEIHALIGENGAGKSTLMNILSGVLRLDSGEIYIRDRKVVFLHPKDAIREGIGMVHQNFKLVPNFTVTENIFLGNEPRKYFRTIVDRNEMKKNIEKLFLKYNSLYVNPNKLVGNLPIGIQQRVEILKALYREAEILILDEPTSILTPKEVDRFFEIIKSLSKQNKTVIFITHKIREVFAISDQITVMCKGKTSTPRKTNSTSVEEIIRMMFAGKKVNFQEHLKKTSKKNKKNIFEVRNLRVFNNVGLESVKNLSFEIKKGEVLAIAGISGNGQRELAEALIGLRSICAGEIMIDGEDVTKMSTKERREKGMIYVPDDRVNVGIVAKASIAENVIMGNHKNQPFNRNGFLNNTAIIKYAQKLTLKYNIKLPESGVNTAISTLSGGNSQKTIIAREFSFNGKVAILFQPIQGLDIKTAQYVNTKIIEKANEGYGILLISMDLDEIFILADRILVICEGKINGVHYPKKITKEEIGLYMTGVKHNKVN